MKTGKYLNESKLNICMGCYTQYKKSLHKLPIFKNGKRIFINDPNYCCKTCATPEEFDINDCF